jgi:LuxR family transcriptional regulator, maltose regulon positive regulatory protein
MVKARSHRLPSVKVRKGVVRFSELPSVTVRKETVQRGTAYWYAYRRVQGKMVKRYVGRSADLTPARLEEVASALGVSAASSADPTPAAPQASSDPQRDKPSLQRTRTAGMTRARTRAAASVRERGSGKNNKLPPAHLLLATKFHVPRIAARLVGRPHVYQRLQRGIERPLTLVTAPAGFGKTASLGDWVQQSGLAVAWVSLDASDNDPLQFWTYVFTALSRTYDGIADTALAMLHAPQSPPLAVVLRALLNAVAASPREVVLVLDDYHLITTPEIHEGIAALLEHPPAQLHLYLAARSEPPLPLARLRAYNQVNEIRADDLRFRPDEVGTFLVEIVGVQLPIDDVMTLAERTDGWVAGLQLAALSLQGHPDPARFVTTFSGSHRHVVTYLGEEILAAQPDDIQSFLLRTSILDRMCGPLCDAVTGHSDGAAMLDRLERANLFLVPLDDEGRWYRYYHLFADLLRLRLSRERPDLVPELHRRAARWLEENGWVVEAAEHLFAAQDMEAAAELIERAAAAIMLRGEVMTLLRLLERLPDEVVEARPLLCLYHAEVLFARGQLITAELRIAAAERALFARDYDAGRDPMELQGEQRALAGHIASDKAVLDAMRGDGEAAMARAQEALAALPKHDSVHRGGVFVALGHAHRLRGELAKADAAYAEASQVSFAAGNVFIGLLALNFRAMIAVQQGRLRQAEDLRRRVIAATESQGAASSMAGSAYAALGDLSYERNDLVGAKLAVEQAIALGEQWANIEDQVDGYMRLAFVYQAQGNAMEAEAAVRHAAQLMEALAQSDMTIPWLPPYVAAMQARLALRQGRATTAAQWLRDYQDELARGRLSSDYLLQELMKLTSARLLLAHGEIAETAKLLDALLTPAEAEERAGSALEILALRALAAQAEGSTERALDLLERSVSLAEPGGYVRLFVDEGTPMRSLLARLRERMELGSLLRRYLETLLAAFGADRPVRPARVENNGLLEPISARELEVLHLMAEGHANQEIARQLVVASSTVKTHVHHLFAKLQAADRLQAVTRARQLGLLER